MTLGWIVVVASLLMGLLFLIAGRVSRQSWGCSIVMCLVVALVFGLFFWNLGAIMGAVDALGDDPFQERLRPTPAPGWRQYFERGSG
jgi:hypothetical protein